MIYVYFPVNGKAEEDVPYLDDDHFRCQECDTVKSVTEEVPEHPNICNGCIAEYLTVRAEYWGDK